MLTESRPVPDSEQPHRYFRATGADILHVSCLPSHTPL